MLGATHACANPLSARYGTTHGVAIAVMLPHVVRWNAPAAKDGYAALLGAPRRRARDEDAAETLARRLEDFAIAGHLSLTLSDVGVTSGAIPELAELASQQWTGTFNPRPFDAKAAEEIYRAAL
jgi:alcohol dehydrogenase